MGARIQGKNAFIVSEVVLALDQLSKQLAHLHLRGHRAIEVIPNFFDLTYSRNPGGVLGSFSGLGEPWRTLLLTLLPLVAIGMIGTLLWRGNMEDRASAVGLSLKLSIW